MPANGAMQLLYRCFGDRKPVMCSQSKAGKDLDAIPVLQSHTCGIKKFFEPEFRAYEQYFRCLPTVQSTVIFWKFSANLKATKYIVDFKVACIVFSTFWMVVRNAVSLHDVVGCPRGVFNIVPCCLCPGRHSFDICYLISVIFRLWNDC